MRYHFGYEVPLIIINYKCINKIYCFKYTPKSNFDIKNIKRKVDKIVFYKKIVKIYLKYLTLSKEVFLCNIKVKKNF